MSLTAENQGVADNSDRTVPLLAEDNEDQQALLEYAESYLREFVAPLASEIDDNPEALKQALQGLGDRSLLALRVPQVWGGAGVSEVTYRHFQQLVPRYSGALAFLQTQHQSAAGFFTNSENESLKRQRLIIGSYLKSMFYLSNPSVQFTRVIRKMFYITAFLPLAVPEQDSIL